MRSKLLLVLGLCALGASANAQIISTSIPQAAAGAPEKKVAFHVMVGYASWDYSALKTVERDFNREFSGLATLDIGKPDGFIVAGDVVFKAGESIDVGVGGWYNSANFDATLTFAPILGGDTVDIASNDGNLFSGYANVFYKAIGVQFGFVDNKSTLKSAAGLDSPDQESKQTDTNFFLVGRYAKERFGISVGLGGYKYGKLEINGIEVGEGETVPSGFANLSVKVVKNLSVDAGVWYIGESDIKDDDATRLTIGLGYTF